MCARPDPADHGAAVLGQWNAPPPASTFRSWSSEERSCAGRVVDWPSSTCIAMREDRTVDRLRFGVFEVELRAGELRKRGVRIRLQEQPFQVLAMLIQRPGEIVTREELRTRLWSADTFVDFDHGVNKAINRIRDAIGDSATSPRFIETVARRGYRFIGDVTAVEQTGVSPREPPVDTPPGFTAEHTGPPPEPGPAHSRRIWSVAGVAVAIVFAVVLFVRLRSGPPIAPIHSLAVLPLENVSGDVSQEYFADGMTDELITTLGQISALRVISRTSAMLYKGARKPLAQIARELDVDAVVDGAVFRSGNQVRITAEIIDARNDTHLWSHSFSGELRDALALQQTVARAIADQISRTVNSHERAVLRQSAVVDPQAYEAYLKGRYFWNKRTGDDFRKASEYFNQAIARDPTYAPAYSGLADTYALMGDWEYGVLAPLDALPRAKAAAIKAIALDDALGEAHTSLAFLLDAFDWDLASADREFRASDRPQPRLRYGASLVRLALEPAGQKRRSDRGNEEGPTPGPAVAHHQRGLRGTPAHRASRRGVDSAEPQDARDGRKFSPRAQPARRRLPRQSPAGGGDNRIAARRTSVGRECHVHGKPGVGPGRIRGEERRRTSARGFEEALPLGLLERERNRASSTPRSTTTAGR